MTDKYAVLGNPIAHSQSPAIHAAFAKQTNQDMCYEKVLAPLDGFSKAVNKLINQGYKGANVTVPFKFEACGLATQLKLPAKRAGAVNTLSFADDHINGDNTDGLGLVRDIEHNLHKGLQSKRILLLGAGGAAEGVLYPLIDAAPSSLFIANRSVEKAVAMIDKVKLLPEYQSIRFSANSYEDLNMQKFDIVINATSVGLSDVALPISDALFADGCLAYDMMYGRETPFMAQAREAGAQVADGLGMLVEQAAEAFYLWRGVRPDSKAVIKKMRAL
ncbi:MAG: shikimate dehydrogenase [Methylophilaceae bacterium]